MPPPNVVRGSLDPRLVQPGQNELSFPLVGIRRLHVFMLKSKDSRASESDVWWYLNCWATLVDPFADLPRLPSYANVTLAPSVLAIPPLGASMMHVATAFWPGEPPAAQLSVKFTTQGNQPQGHAVGLIYGDTTPHDYAGFFRTPFGFAQARPRLVEPLPEDPEILERLQLDDQLPPLALPERARKRRTGHE
ncbi:MAG: hypothetical protein ABJE95_35650 [Byssovorax sp.]